MEGNHYFWCRANLASLKFAMKVIITAKGAAFRLKCIANNPRQGWNHFRTGIWEWSGKCKYQSYEFVYAGLYSTSNYELISDSPQGIYSTEWPQLYWFSWSRLLEFGSDEITIYFPFINEPLPLKCRKGCRWRGQWAPCWYLLPGRFHLEYLSAQYL